MNPAKRVCQVIAARRAKDWERQLATDCKAREHPFGPAQGRPGDVFLRISLILGFPGASLDGNSGCTFTNLAVTTTVLSPARIPLRAQ
jgi:hypothetical protein